jgi:alanyl-tRNA synthetase
LFARSKELSFDMAKLVADAAERIGGRGGGRPDFAQAGAPATDEAHVRAALDWAAAQLAHNTTEDHTHA